MIQKYVDRFMAKKDELEAKYSLSHPGSYEEIVKDVIELIVDPDDNYGEPDPENIHVIDDGDWQGTMLFIIPEKTYQPWQYWYVRVSYGSCSGCDTLQAIQSGSEWTDEGDYAAPTPEQTRDYMTLALHVIQWLSPMQDGVEEDDGF
jgi:hypothetical protein